MKYSLQCSLAVFRQDVPARFHGAAQKIAEEAKFTKVALSLSTNRFFQKNSFPSSEIVIAIVTVPVAFGCMLAVPCRPPV